MKRKISVSKSTFGTPPNCLIIGTHSGIFHADDVIAVSMFCLNNHSSSIHIIRSRDEAELKKCNLLVDIGNGKYDHHQVGGNGKRANGVPYASAGLYWRYNGIEIIKKIAKNEFNVELSGRDSESIFYFIDSKYIQEIDKQDNGIETSSTIFDYIPLFLPNWKKLDTSDDLYEEAFHSVLRITISIFNQLLQDEINTLISFNYIMDIYKKGDGDRILEIPAQSYPWLMPITKLNEEKNANIDFVIFPYPNGGWAAQSVPPSLKEKFQQRVRFPKSWAGQTKDLPKISGVYDATFCHSGLFFVRANSRDGVISLCNIALGF